MSPSGLRFTSVFHPGANRDFPNRFILPQRGSQEERMSKNLLPGLVSPREDAPEVLQ
jgi:hypothetical protein